MGEAGKKTGPCVLNHHHVLILLPQSFVTQHTAAMPSQCRCPGCRRCSIWPPYKVCLQEVSKYDKKWYKEKDQRCAWCKHTWDEESPRGCPLGGAGAQSSGGPATTSGNDDACRPGGGPAIVRDGAGGQTPQNSPTGGPATPPGNIDAARPPAQDLDELAAPLQQLQALVVALGAVVQQLQALLDQQRQTDWELPDMPNRDREEA